MQLIEKGQSWTGTRQYQRDDREARFFGLTVQCLEVLQALPRPRASGSEQNDHRIRPADRVGKSRNPEGTCTEVVAVEEDVEGGIVPGKPIGQAASDLAIRRVVTQKDVELPRHLRYPSVSLKGAGRQGRPLGQTTRKASLSPLGVLYVWLARGPCGCRNA